ncbi:MAG: hypothetical protein ACK4M3_01945 [Pyrobaculum sp.]
MDYAKMYIEHLSQEKENHLLTCGGGLVYKICKTVEETNYEKWLEELERLKKEVQHIGQPAMAAKRLVSRPL